MRNTWPILIVDDEEVMCESMAAWLREDGYRVDTASNGRRAVELAAATDYAIYFVDLKMPGGMDGIDTMIVKPCNPQEISILVSRILKLKKLQRENAILRKKINRQYHHRDVITKNARMEEILSLARDIASLRSTVLIRGESGTGKELVARAIHYSGDRATKPFITVSCAALTETLLESELFGYEKGAFTGAAAQTRGKFELANSGTIFLDEIGDISPKLQADLLRVLQERCFYRVGGSDEVRVDSRVIAATNKDLAEEVRQGRFRDDLYYRLNVIEIRIPPLRERREDIPLLAGHFVERISHELGKETAGISEGALRILMDHDWPGNVRELENVIERAIVTCRNGSLGESDFVWLSRRSGVPAEWSVPDVPLAELERRAIIAALERRQGNVKEAAVALGIDRSTLYDKLKRYEIPR
jgi:DNA-binding NtrC family response regulator